jgi:predicted transcriptional regulator
MTEKLLDLTRHIVIGYVANNAVPAAGLPTLIADVAAALSGLSAPAAPEADKPIPAVNPKRSVLPEYIICLEDGKTFKSMKRHLGTHYGLTPEAYRTKWGLPADYPMVAPNYAKARSVLAKTRGLGRKRKVAAPVEAPAPVAKVSNEVAKPSRRRGKTVKTVLAEAAPAKRRHKAKAKAE